MLLKNKVCLVTGAGKGIGRAVVDVFLKEGAFVYANDCVNGSLDDLKDNTNISIMYFDVVDEPSCKKAILQIMKEKGCLDVLVNNAGIMEDALIGTISRKLMEKLFSVNVFGSMQLLQLASKLMIKQHSGSIINLSSIVGITGNPGQLVYSATKGAIIAMTKTAAKELGSRGIRVNAVAPGMIDTDMMRSVGEYHLQKHINNIPVKKLGQPIDIANACLYLASDMSAYVNGEILQVDASVLV